MVSIVAIYGSHRRNKNSDMLLNKVLEGIGADFASVTRIYASSPGIKHCTACEGCSKDGRCVLKDEMQDIYAVLDKADIVITASPVYFHTVTSHLKKLIDRCQAVWAAKYLNKNDIISKKRRLGYIICTAGPKREDRYFECTTKVLSLFYLCTNIQLEDVMLVSDVDQMPVENREDVLRDALNMGKKIKKTLEAGR